MLSHVTELVSCTVMISIPFRHQCDEQATSPPKEQKGLPAGAMTGCTLLTTSSLIWLPFICPEGGGDSEGEIYILLYTGTGIYEFVYKSQLVYLEHL